MTDNDDDGNHGFGTDGFQMMGMMNALKTGDVYADMIIAMCVPFFLRMLFGWMGKLDDLFDWKVWARWFEQPCNYHERFVSHSTTRNFWGGVSNVDEDAQNSVLLKAIKLYLHQVVQLKLKSAHLDLTGMEDKKSYGCYDYDSDSDDEDDDECHYGSRKTLVGTLSRYKIIKQLPNNEWHNLGMYGNQPSPVMMRIEHVSKRDEENNDEKKEKSAPEINNTTFHFTSPGEDAIDDFIDSAYQWYIGELRKLEHNSRHLYEMKVPEIKLGNDRDSGGSDGTSYKRYKLTEEKGFDSLFFREKESLLGLIDHFTEKSGKYSIRGYPHKLGILLHGPPGTGKTSLIKSFAQYTGRSIVNVPLSKVSTNGELMSIFFDRKYHVEGTSVPVKLGFKDVIFVMEDVDAASNVVKRRDGQSSSDLVEPEKVDLPMPKSIWRMFLESTSSECMDLVKDLMEKSERLKKEAEAQKPVVLRAIAQRMTALPALGLVGEGGDDPAIARICEEAMEYASSLNDQYSKLDEILSSHAQSINAMLEAGAEIDDKFVDELLGDSSCLTGLPPPYISTPSTAEVSHPNRQDSPQLQFSASNFQSDNFFSDSPQARGANNASKNIGLSGFGPSLWKPNPDQLSLSGLLNVLDGVVDTPGRILIMTSNHPEMLDPALIRPGRIDKKIMLGYMASTDIICMLEHYFQTTLSNEQITRVETVVNGDGRAKSRLSLTPAQVEQLAAEHDDLDDMIDSMAKMAHASPSKAKFVAKSTV